MVRAVHEHNDRRSSGYGDIPGAVIGDSHAINHPKRRVEAERLLNDLRGKLELGNVAETQRPISQHGIKLLPYPFETIRMRA